MSAYRWEITRTFGFGGKGVQGPHDADESITSNPKAFIMKDDDGVTLWHGMLYGDWFGYEPLDDYGHASGATCLWMDGECAVEL